VRKNSSDTPSCVGLGKHNAWVVVYPSGHMSWNMQGHYTGLEQILKQTTAGSVDVSDHQSLFGDNPDA
jgi:hypothetical protein